MAIFKVEHEFKRYRTKYEVENIENTYPGAMLKSKIAMFIEGKTSSYAANTFPNAVDVVCKETVASCKMGAMFKKCRFLKPGLG